MTTQLRSRKLKQAMGRKGAEGEKDDDWLAVDCYDLVVHFMLPCKYYNVMSCYVMS